MGGFNRSMAWNHIRDLYNAHRFRDAYDDTRTFWDQGELPPDLETADLILAGRLAERLGGLRLSRQLWRLAQDREPQHPDVILFAEDRLDRRSSYYTFLNKFEERSELEGATEETQMYWMAGRAHALGVMRDFRAAEHTLARVKERFGEHDWLTLIEGEIAFARDRWAASEELAMQVFETSPLMYHNLLLLSRIAVRRRNIPALLERFESIRESVQDYEIAYLHTWYLVAFAERSTGSEKAEGIRMASIITERYDDMVPLADRHIRKRLALSRLDVATVKGDRETVLQEAKHTRSKWHDTLAQNLSQNPDGERRFVQHRPVWQIRNTCLPCSVCTLHPDVNLRKLVGELTYAGTSMVRCMEWLKRESGIHSIPFVATEETARRLIEAGVGFIFLTGGDNWAHAMAAVGLDEATRTLLIHDPAGTRIREVMLEEMATGEGPFGPQCVALVEPDRVEAVQALVPEAERVPYAHFLAYTEYLRLGDHDGAREPLKAVAQNYPDHPFTRRMQAIQMMQTSQLPRAIDELEQLLADSPSNVHIRSDLLTAVHRARNTRKQTEVYRELMRKGTWGEYQAAQARRDPVYVARYADMLGLTGSGHEQAAALLQISLRRYPGEAELWHIFGDVLWREGRLEQAWLPLKVSSQLAEENEHYARSLADLGCNIGRLDEALGILESRAQDAGRAVGAGAPWVTWIDTLADFGFPMKAQEALAAGLRNSQTMQSFSPLPFTSRPTTASRTRLRHCFPGSAPCPISGEHVMRKPCTARAWGDHATRLRSWRISSLAHRPTPTWLGLSPNCWPAAKVLKWSLNVDGPG